MTPFCGYRVRRSPPSRALLCGQAARRRLWPARNRVIRRGASMMHPRRVSSPEIIDAVPHPWAGLPMITRHRGLPRAPAGSRVDDGTSGPGVRPVPAPPASDRCPEFRHRAFWFMLHLRTSPFRETAVCAGETTNDRNTVPLPERRTCDRSSVHADVPGGGCAGGRGPGRRVRGTAHARDRQLHRVRCVLAPGRGGSPTGSAARS